MTATTPSTWSNNQPLAPFTTVGIGGPAEFFCTVSTVEELLAAVRSAIELKLSVTILGWGANTLISDAGIKGLVIRNQSANLRIYEGYPSELPVGLEPLGATEPPRLQRVATELTDATNNVHSDKTVLTPTLNQPNSTASPAYIEVASGYSLPVLISRLLSEGITGLEWFARIPATLGGGVVNNIHGGTHYLSEYVVAVEVLDATGQLLHLPAVELEFAYDYSRFHHSKEVITRVWLQLYRGNVEQARQTMQIWAKQKTYQPQRSLGCIFQNLPADEVARLKLATSSVGYVIDKMLGLKGFRIGDAQISDNHAAFIINLDHSTATDYLAVINHIVDQAKSQLGLTLRPEIFFQGFTF